MAENFIIYGLTEPNGGELRYVGAANRGRKHTSEAVEKISTASRNRSAETRAKLSAAATRQHAAKRST